MIPAEPAKTLNLFNAQSFYEYTETNVSIVTLALDHITFTRPGRPIEKVVITQEQIQELEEKINKKKWFHYTEGSKSIHVNLLFLQAITYIPQEQAFIYKTSGNPKQVITCTNKVALELLEFLRDYLNKRYPTSFFTFTNNKSTTYIPLEFLSYLDINLRQRIIRFLSSEIQEEDFITITDLTDEVMIHAADIASRLNWCVLAKENFLKCVNLKYVDCVFQTSKKVALRMAETMWIGLREGEQIIDAETCYRCLSRNYRQLRPENLFEMNSWGQGRILGGDSKVIITFEKLKLIKINNNRIYVITTIPSDNPNANLRWFSFHRTFSNRENQENFEAELNKNLHFYRFSYKKNKIIWINCLHNPVPTYFEKSLVFHEIGKYELKKPEVNKAYHDLSILIPNFQHTKQRIP